LTDRTLTKNPFLEALFERLFRPGFASSPSSIYRQLAELTTSDAIEGFDARLKELYEQARSEQASGDLGSIPSLDWLREALWTDPSIGKAHLATLRQHPLSILLLEEEITSGLGFDEELSIDDALQHVTERGSAEQQSAVHDAWHCYATEQRWAKLRGIAEDGTYHLARPLGEVTHTTFELTDPRFRDLPLLDLPMAPRDARRLVRSLQKLFPHRTLNRLGDVPVTDRSIRCIRGVGQITLDRFRRALLEYAYIWRWQVTGLDRGLYGQPVPAFDRQIHLEEDLESRPALSC
jgi:hypothetical protein